MKSLTVRGVDEDVYEALRDLASRNHRSMQEHVKMILEREVSLSRGGIFSAACLSGSACRGETGGMWLRTSATSVQDDVRD